MSKLNGLASRLDRLTANDGKVCEFYVGESVMRIRKDQIIDTLRDLAEGRNTLNAGIVRNATASRGFGKMLLLRQMLEED